jgi:hypothetical protein
MYSMGFLSRSHIQVCNVFVMIGHALTTTLHELGLCRILGGRFYYDYGQ